MNTTNDNQPATSVVAVIVLKEGLPVAAQMVDVERDVRFTREIELLSVAHRPGVAGCPYRLSVEPSQDGVSLIERSFSTQGLELTSVPIPLTSFYSCAVAAASQVGVPLTEAHSYYVAPVGSELYNEAIRLSGETRDDEAFEIEEPDGATLSLPTANSFTTMVHPSQEEFPSNEPWLQVDISKHKLNQFLCEAKSSAGERQWLAVGKFNLCVERCHVVISDLIELQSTESEFCCRGSGEAWLRMHDENSVIVGHVHTHPPEFSVLSPSAPDLTVWTDLARQSMATVFGITHYGEASVAGDEAIAFFGWEQGILRKLTLIVEED